MNTNTTNTNPWPIIRWAAAAVLYTLTVIIGIGEIQSKSGQLSEAADKIAALEKWKSDTKKGLRELEASSQSISEGFDQAITLLKAEEARQNTEAETIMAIQKAMEASQSAGKESR